MLLALVSVCTPWNVGEYIRGGRLEWSGMVAPCLSPLGTSLIVFVSHFLTAAGLASLYAMGLVLTTWLWPTDKSLAGKAEGAEGGVSGNRVQT